MFIGAKQHSFTRTEHTIRTAFIAKLITKSGTLTLGKEKYPRD